MQAKDTRSSMKRESAIGVVYLQGHRLPQSFAAGCPSTNLTWEVTGF